MKIALVYDRVNKWGGAERILTTLHEIWPQAPLYTAVYDDKKAKWANIFKIIPSFLNHIPYVKNRHELLPLFTPIAFESINFNNYDIVISITSAEAKGIITSPNTLHICYCLTPTRYLWSGYFDYLKQPGLGILNMIVSFFMKIFIVKLRIWDYIASQRPNHYLAISENVAKRIKTYYHKDAQIIYPPVDVKEINKNANMYFKEYFLIVSRLVPYKKIDYVISAFNKINKTLIIIGNGLDERRLKKMAAKNIIFIDADLTDEQLGCYYQNCKALIFPGEEDFGLTAVEVQAYGKPVIAYDKGGVQESILEGITGELYNNQSIESLLSVLAKFESSKYDSVNCINNSKKFSKKLFKARFKKIIMSIWRDFQDKR